MLPDTHEQISSNLKDTCEVNKDNFKEIVKSENKDVLLLIYDSFGNMGMNKQVIKYVNKVALRFKDLEISSVKVCAIDVSNDGYPTEI